MSTKDQMRIFVLEKVTFYKKKLTVWSRFKSPNWSGHPFLPVKRNRNVKKSPLWDAYGSKKFQCTHTLSSLECSSSCTIGWNPIWKSIRIFIHLCFNKIFITIQWYSHFFPRRLQNLALLVTFDVQQQRQSQEQLLARLRNFLAKDWL